jgi:hypothetical protein
VSPRIVEWQLIPSCNEKSQILPFVSFESSRQSTSFLVLSVAGSYQRAWCTVHNHNSCSKCSPSAWTRVSHVTLLACATGYADDSCTTFAPAKNVRLLNTRRVSAHVIGRSRPASSRWLDTTGPPGELQLDMWTDGSRQARLLPPRVQWPEPQTADGVRGCAPSWLSVRYADILTLMVKQQNRKSRSCLGDLGLQSQLGDILRWVRYTRSSSVPPGRNNYRKVGHKVFLTHRFTRAGDPKLRQVYKVPNLLLLQWRDSPHRALSSSVVRLQIPLCPAHLLHPLMFSNNESLLTSSHLSRGLPTGLLPRNFPSRTFLGILELSIRTIRPAHCNILNFESRIIHSLFRLKGTLKIIHEADVMQSLH